MVVVEDDVVDDQNAHHHDPDKLAAVLLRLLQDDRPRPPAPAHPATGGHGQLTRGCGLRRDVKGELARIEPARACCREAELAGLRFADGAITTLDPSTVRVAVRLGAGRAVPRSADRGSPGRATTSPSSAADRQPRRVELVHGRGLRSAGVPARRRPRLGSISFGRTGPHVEFVFRTDRRRGPSSGAWRPSGIRSASYERRGRTVVATSPVGSSRVPPAADRGPRRAARARVRAGGPRRPEPAEPAPECRGGEREPDGARRRAPGRGPSSGWQAPGGSTTCRRACGPWPMPDEPIPKPIWRRSPASSSWAGRRSTTASGGSSSSPRLRRHDRCRPAAARRRQLEDEPARPAAAGALAREVARRTPRPPDGGRRRRLPAGHLARRRRVCAGWDRGEGRGAEHGCQESGAYTGEISPLMLVGIAEYVIVGHSERRRLFGETDDAVAARSRARSPTGWSRSRRWAKRPTSGAAGDTERVIERQVRAVVSGLDRVPGSGLVVAYEPVWAIGTGDAASGDRCAGRGRTDPRASWPASTRTVRPRCASSTAAAWRQTVPRQCLAGSGRRRRARRRSFARRRSVRGHRPGRSTVSRRP